MRQERRFLKKSVPLLLILSFCLCLSANVIGAVTYDRPLYKEMERSPLCYLRLPLPWNRTELSELQRERLKEKVLTFLAPSAGKDFAIRSLLRCAQGGLELMVLPPENKYLPLPAFVLRMESHGPEVIKAMEDLVVAVVSEIQGSPATWVVFKDASTPDRVMHEAFLLGCYMRIIQDERGTGMYFSNNIDFLQQFNGKGQDLELGIGSEMDDAFVYLDPAEAIQQYDSWLKRAKVSFPYAMITSTEGFGIGKLKIFTQGSGVNFEVKMKGDWAGGIPKHLPKIETGAEVVYPMKSEFHGAVYLPHWEKTEIEAFLQQWSFPLSTGQKLGLSELLPQLGKSLSFSWPETLPAPLFRLEIQDEKKFEAALIRTLGPQVHFATEGQSSYRHLTWTKGELSFRVADHALYFSPLLHALKDSEKISAENGPKNDAVAWINFPLEGRLTGNYYAMVNALIQSSAQSRIPLNPNDFPSFVELHLKDAPWSAKAGLKVQYSKDGFELNGRMPYGLPGLMGGMKLQSSNWVYFLSLLQLTYKSF